MSKPAIHIQDLHKEFRLSHSGIASLKTLATRWKYSRHIETLQVLRGISFDVMPGECLAVIGRNGAGKSTLLSILAQIYRPTSGTVEIAGRVAPLLELGAGFHPDLSGLENIFVNGMILGISRKDLASRLPSIIEFSELYNQIDSPVRTYSSGMSARLGFAIAVHVDADVLLVDEVLSVGDFEFREKCAQKIDQLRKEGKTILMVSHAEADIVRLADRAIWLQRGLVALEGSPSSVLEAYRTQSVNVLAGEG